MHKMQVVAFIRSVQFQKARVVMIAICISVVYCPEINLDEMIPKTRCAWPRLLFGDVNGIGNSGHAVNLV